MTQQNAALVEEAAAAASSLESQAGQLQHAVERFRLGKAGEMSESALSEPALPEATEASGASAAPRPRGQVRRPVLRAVPSLQKPALEHDHRT